ncbi:MAG: LTA synthase family protein [Candidatus Obscuribacterales bacterium]|nr:LTA synthase family protein [Candidatus Obscuribacterales bacterium]
MNKLPLHPFLFAAFSILSFYSVSTVFCIPQVLALPMIVAMGAVGVLLLLFMLISRNVVVAAFMTTTLVFCFFAFRFTYESICNLQMLLLYFVLGSRNIPISATLLLGVWLLMAGIALVACMRNSRYLEGKNSLLNTIAVCCLLLSAVDVAGKEVVRRHSATKVVQAVQEPVKIQQLQASAKPDIYYIILDGCARPDILKMLYHYDNDKFTNYLKSKGFYIADESHSNYQMTPLSLAATLNMNYVNAVENIQPKSNDWFPMIELIENNFVVKSLKSIGYKYVMFKSDWSVTQKSPLADSLISLSWNDVFLNRLLSTTIWTYAEDYVRVLRNEACSHWLKTFDRAANLDDIQSPKFVFLHCILPHPPYLFNADGSRVQKGPLVMHLEEYADKHSFVEQVKFTESKVENLIDQLLSHSRKPVIIIQSDHGPASLDSSEGIESPTNDFLKERMSIINAYYFPEGKYSTLYPEISPVNTFRVLLNQYFGTQLEVLQDKSYFSNYLQPYRFIDVTNQLN